MNALEVRDARFSYPPHRVQVLDGVDLAVAAGSFVALLGPNGAGKSTLLKLAAGVMAPVAGEVRVEGVAVARRPRRDLARTLAFVPQDVQFWLPFTCREVVEMGRYPHQRGLTVDGSVVDRCMAETGVTALAGRRVTEVSGGEAQRVRIAQALAQEGRILVLDEPTSHLDVSFQVEVMDLLARLNRERGMTVLVSLHDLNLASRWCDRIVVLQAGRVAADGPPSSVITAGLLREVFGVEVDLEPGERPRVFLRPGGLSEPVQGGVGTSGA